MRTLPDTNTRFQLLRANEAYRRFMESDRRLVDWKPFPVAIELPVHGSYAALLFSPKWREKRVEILNRDNNRCIHCHTTENLQVHHRQYHFSIRENKYKDPWEYANSLLITLCEPCHRRGHEHYKIPTIIL
jgi:5-methylcytosine-specific restriction endonuclease McrA